MVGAAVVTIVCSRVSVRPTEGFLLKFTLSNAARNTAIYETHQFSRNVGIEAGTLPSMIP